MVLTVTTKPNTLFCTCYLLLGTVSCVGVSVRSVTRLPELFPSRGSEGRLGIDGSADKWGDRYPIGGVIEKSNFEPVDAGFPLAIVARRVGETGKVGERYSPHYTNHTLCVQSMAPLTRALCTPHTHT